MNNFLRWRSFLKAATLSLVALLLRQNSLRARAGSERKQPKSSFTTKRGSHMRTYTAVTVPTQFVEANGVRFAYRRWGKQAGLPLVFNQHFTGNMDNWDPAVLDVLAKEREVIIFNT